MVDIRNQLSGYEFTGCFVRNRNAIVFGAQNYANPDPLEPRPTQIIFHYLDAEPGNDWGYVEVDDATGLHGCLVTDPADRWVFVLDDGAVFVAGGGEADFEDDIIQTGMPFFSNVRTIPPGRAFAVGSNRKVYQRTAANRWDPLHDGLVRVEKGPKPAEFGFNDIAGLAPNEIYACGGLGDLWHYDGNGWAQIDVPTNLGLRRMCVGPDSNIYIMSDIGDLIVGRGDSWTLHVKPEEIDVQLENLVPFGSRIILSSTDRLIAFENGEWGDAELSPPSLSSYARIASGDGILLVAGIQDAAVFDGETWRVVLEPSVS